MVNSSSSLAISCATSPKTRGFAKSYKKFSGNWTLRRLESRPTATRKHIQVQMLRLLFLCFLCLFVAKNRTSLCSNWRVHALCKTTHPRRPIDSRFRSDDLLRLVSTANRGCLLPEDGGICTASGYGRTLFDLLSLYGRKTKQHQTTSDRARRVCRGDHRRAG